MSEKKHKYYITVPMTGSITMSIETDEPIGDDEEAFELACEKWNSGDHGLDVGGKEDGTELGEIDLHKYLNRGNVCHAVCPEIEWVKE